jgi:hypothetical protein
MVRRVGRIVVETVGPVAARTEIGRPRVMMVSETAMIMGQIMGLITGQMLAPIGGRATGRRQRTTTSTVGMEIATPMAAARGTGREQRGFGGSCFSGWMRPCSARTGSVLRGTGASSEHMEIDTWTMTM